REERAQARALLARFRAPSEEHVAELELRRTREIDARGHRLDLRLDADARIELRDRLRDLLVVDVAVARTEDREREAVGISRLGEELLRAFRIVFRGLDLLARAEEEIGKQLPGRHRLPLHDPLVDRVAVDRDGKGFSHARVPERIL